MWEDEGRTREGGGDDYAWGESGGGLRLGLKASAAAVEAGGHVDLSAAVRNVSSRAAEVGSDIRLLTRGPGGTFEDASGPRSGTPLRLEPGELLEVVSWRVGEQLNRPGSYAFSAAYRPREGGEIRSGECPVEVRGAGADDEESV